MTTAAEQPRSSSRPPWLIRCLHCSRCSCRTMECLRQLQFSQQLVLCLSRLHCSSHPMNRQRQVRCSHPLVRCLPRLCCSSHLMNWHRQVHCCVPRLHCSFHLMNWQYHLSGLVYVEFLEAGQFGLRSGQEGIGVAETKPVPLQRGRQMA